MLPGCAEEFGEIKAMLGGMCHTLDRLDKSINGNGQPGLAQRVTTMEAAGGARWKMIALIFTPACGIAAYFAGKIMERVFGM